MRKIVIVLCAVLLVLSISSCEKDKSEEIISTYLEYLEGMFLNRAAYSAFNGLYTWTGDEVDTMLTDGEALKSTDYPNRILKITDGLNNFNVTGAVTKSGKITGSKKTEAGSFSEALIFADAVIEVTYTDYSGAEEKKDQKATLTINGTYSYGWDKSTETKISTYSYDFTVNNKTYKVTKVYDDNASKITAATVNGKDVNLALVNANNWL